MAPPSFRRSASLGRHATKVSSQLSFNVDEGSLCKIETTGKCVEFDLESGAYAPLH